MLVHRVTTRTTDVVCDALLMQDIVIMCQTLEKVFISKLTQMPAEVCTVARAINTHECDVSRGGDNEARSS
jgi:hypothetical protein